MYTQYIFTVKFISSAATMLSITKIGISMSEN